MQRKAVTAKKTAKPLSPMVIDFELRAWLIWNLSEGHAANNHSRADRDLIEINLADDKDIGGGGTSRRRVFSSDINDDLMSEQLQ
jgi:hypothetical protein